MAASDWVPLYRDLVWPAFIVLAIVVFQRPIRRALGPLLSDVGARVRAGADVSVGRDGFKLTGGPKLEPAAPPPAPEAEEAAEEEPSAVQSVRSAGRRKAAFRAPRRAATQERTDLYLVHKAAAPDQERDGRRWRPITVALDADADATLDGVERVVYHLHPTFRDPERTVTSRETNFELRTRAWGQFNLLADVYLRGDPVPVRLSRYLNF